MQVAAGVRTAIGVERGKDMGNVLPVPKISVSLSELCTFIDEVASYGESELLLDI
jgi:hypothetical protein